MISFPLGIRGRRLLAAALLGVLVVAVAWRHASSAPAPAPLRVAPVVPSASPPPRAGQGATAARRLVVDVAAPVADGQQVLVPRRGRGAVAAGSGGAAPAPSGPVSLSSATVEQLDELPGVGPVTAQKIVAYRQEHGAFRSVDELDAVPGIGPARLADLRELVTP